MAIKITYLFLKTISISENIKLFATDGFAFNENSPIKAIGTLYFLKKNGKIFTNKINSADIKSIKEFQLPKKLDYTIFSKENEPLYILPAV